MLRYLREAFWARPSLLGIGRIPWNVLFVAGAVILGFGEHAVWLAGAGLETLYLYGLATNPRFQHWVDAIELARLHAEGDALPTKIVEGLGSAQRSRLSGLEEKCKEIERLYKDTQNEDYLYDSNRDALRKLVSIYARLLVAQRNLQMLDVSSREADLKGQIAAIQRELTGRSMSEPLRESKTATLGILGQRLKNLHRRSDSLAEIESDLTRIEQQVDLAVEDASLKGRPAVISANIDLVSHLLDDSYGADLDAEPPADGAAPPAQSQEQEKARGREIEN
jgi:hypothetical protein